MSEIKMKRRTRQVTITLHTTTALATSIRMEDYAGGVIDLGTMSTNAATLQMWGASSEGGTYRRLCKTDGSVADITLAASTAAGRIYDLPSEIFGVPYLEILSGTTNSTGTVGIVTLKS